MGGMGTSMKYLKIVSALMLFAGFGVKASDYNLKPGQSRTIKVGSQISTVFVSDPAVADYQVINDNSIVLYAKKPGISTVTVYGSNSTTLASASVNVNPFVNDLSSRVARAFPGSKINIEALYHGEKATYILSGTVPDEETKELVYSMVGSLVGEGGREISTEPPEDEGSESSSTNIEFMYRKVYDNIINRLQLPSSNQVNVKLTVVEVTKGFTDSLGIDWSSLTLNSIVNGGSAVNPTGTFNLLGFKGGFDAKNISTVIQAVNNDSLARVLAQPNLTVLSGESASFLVGGEIPIIVQDNDSATVSYKEYGVRLNVAAKVEKKQRIKLFVSNELSSVSGSYAFNEFQIPTLRTRKSSSTIELSNGDSFVIGGLLSEEDRESLTKIPFIGDIPVLGALARSAQTERRKTELVVFATVNLVEPSSTQGNIPLPRFRRTPVENLFTNVGVDGQIREGRLSDNVVSFMSQGGFAK